MKITLNKEFSRIDNIILNIENCDINTLIKLDTLIKKTKNFSILTIEPCHVNQYNFEFNIPKEIEKNQNTKTQFITLMTQIRDTYGRLMRLNISTDNLSAILPLASNATATLQTSIQHLYRLETMDASLNEMLTELKAVANTYFETD